MKLPKKLDEYIIDPKITISLVKVGSARFSVVGKVESQGMHLMTRKISILKRLLYPAELKRKAIRNGRSFCDQMRKIVWFRFWLV